MTQEPSPPETPRPPMRAQRNAVRFGLAALIVVLGLGSVYVLFTRTGKNAPHSGACAQSLDLAAAIDPLAHGELAALSLASTPNPLTRVSFNDDKGARVSVESFHGKTILLNLWATWCIPCRAEMPSLDKLQAALGSDKFSVVPVNIDTVRLEKARGFLHEIGATSLPYYADNSADILQDLRQSEKIVGLPTSILIGKDGCEIGTLAGPAQWDSPDARALIERLEKPAVKADAAAPHAGRKAG